MKIRLFNQTKEREHTIYSFSIDPIDNVSGDVIEIVLRKDLLDKDTYKSIVSLENGELLHAVFMNGKRILVIIDTLLEIEKDCIILRSEDYIWMKVDRPNLHLRIINQQLKLQI